MNIALLVVVCLSIKGHYIFFFLLIDTSKCSKYLVTIFVTPSLPRQFQHILVRCFCGSAGTNKKRMLIQTHCDQQLLHCHDCWIVLIMVLEVASLGLKLGAPILGNTKHCQRDKATNLKHLQGSCLSGLVSKVASAQLRCLWQGVPCSQELGHVVPGNVPRRCVVLEPHQYISFWEQ